MTRCPYRGRREESTSKYWRMSGESWSYLGEDSILDERNQEVEFSVEENGLM